jgi:hypothetical protein
MMNPVIQRSLLLAALVILIVSVGAVRIWSRLMPLPSMADVRDLAEKSPIVFRGRVARVTPIEGLPPHAYGLNSIATFDLDRLYRGNIPAAPKIRFTYSGSPYGMNGHYCINFQPNTYWLVFAVEKSGRFELHDDCEGALAISPLLGPQLKDADWLAQLEADFLAGLKDGSQANRIYSIQRLGGLKLPSSRKAFHRVINGGDETEAKWAVYAALRGGDISVLPKARQMLSVDEQGSPEGAIVFELQHVSDPKAVPDLIAILENATTDFTRSRVLIALAENIKDPRAVPSLAAYISDPDASIQYLALEGLQNITHEYACSLRLGTDKQNLATHAQRCKVWWEEKGKFKSWTQ